MRKAIILIFVMFLVALASADDSQLSVNVSNSAPSVSSVVIAPDDRAASGVQVTIGTVTVRVNATIEELNGIGQINYVKAYVTGPNTIEESPITLVKVAEDIDGVHAIYNGNFGMSESDGLGEYIVNVNVSDLINLSWRNVSFSYVNPPNKRITVCSSGCNFTTIQAGVDAASPGYTVYVYDGIYSYFNVIGKSGLKIVGESMNVKIAGDNAHSDIVFDNVDDSELINFTVYDGWQGIFVDSSYNNNFTNIISHDSYNITGFALINGSSGNNLIDIESYNNLEGIRIVNSDGNTLTNLNSHDNTYDGVYLLNSDSNVISGYTSTNNENGVHVDNSNNNQVINSNLQNNDVGIFIYSGNYTTITGNTLYHNIRGISFTFGESKYIHTTNSNNYRNRVCDINYASYSICEYDYTAPAVVSLSGASGSADKEIDLNWTDVGENWEYGIADSYVLKYSTSPINNSNWDSATTYDTTLWNPSINGTAVTKTVTMPDYGTYYFAMKVEDDSSNLGEISNSIAVLSPEYNISVDSIECVNGKNGYDCNYALSGSTNYLYDILNVSGNVTNSGNLNVTKTVQTKRYESGWSVVDLRDYLFPYGQTTYVDDLHYNISDLSDGDYFHVSLLVDDSSKQIDNARTWSIKEHTGTIWYDNTNYPSLTQDVNTSFYVAFKMKNNNTEADYYQYPFEIIINTTFSIVLTTGGSSYQCYNNNKTCYYDLGKNNPDYSSQYFYWYVNGLPEGTYEIKIKAGVNSNDSPNVLTRVVTVS